MSRVLRVRGDGGQFRITIPDDARVTFAPWAPPPPVDRFGNRPYQADRAKGTLRVYQGAGERNCLGAFSPVYTFYDETLELRRAYEPRVEAQPQGGYEPINRIFAPYDLHDGLVPPMANEPEFWVEEEFPEENA